VPEMEVGPPGSPCMGRSQTTASCAGSTAGVVSVAERRSERTSGVSREGERKRTIPTMLIPSAAEAIAHRSLRMGGNLWDSGLVQKASRRVVDQTTSGEPLGPSLPPSTPSGRGPLRDAPGCVPNNCSLARPWGMLRFQDLGGERAPRRAMMPVSTPRGSPPRAGGTARAESVKSATPSGASSKPTSTAFDTVGPGEGQDVGSGSNRTRASGGFEPAELMSTRTSGC
jgi:hypothetical protein